MRSPGRLRPRSLRTRLVLIATVLATAAVLVCQATGLTLMRSWLVGQVDDRLTDFRPPSPVYRDISGGTAPAHRPPAHEILPSDFRVYFYDAEGRLLPESLGDGRSEPRLRRTVTAGDPVDGRPATVPAEDGGGSWRVVADSGPDGMRAVVALPLDSVEEATSRLLWFSLGIGVATAAGVTLLGGAAVRLGLRPLTRVEHTARSITGGELEQNVTDTSPDTEVGRLGIAFNTMLDQLRAALHRKDRTERRLRRFMADAGHELRTPLTSLQGFAELLLHDPQMSASRRREAHELIAQNADRMSRLVDSLFLLAKLGDAPTTEHGPVDLLSLAADGIAATAVRHPERRVTLAPLGARGAGDPGELDVVEGSGDPHQLAQVLSNLLDNACTHTPTGTRIEVRVGSLRVGPLTGGADRPGRTSANPPLPSGDPAHVIEVADDGPGLSPQDAAQVFDRFYRAQPAAGTPRDGVLAGGSGLGLAIASTIAEAHGGRLELDTGPGEGCVFRLLLPGGPAPGRPGAGRCQAACRGDAPRG
ncbi:sensor histidine kinase [Streptomyces sp. NPDC056749]|uniref:sensor histidine kinase n=1 Tax=Streptomyces sp. NPDC056749 TaxID=3345936 RepID=UPI00369AE6DE